MPGIILIVVVLGVVGFVYRKEVKAGIDYITTKLKGFK